MRKVRRNSSWIQRQEVARQRHADAGDEGRTSLSAWSSASELFDRASVALKLEPSASHISTITSVRSLVGKNCFSVRPMPMKPSTRPAAVMPMVIQRWLMHQSMVARRRA